MTLPSRSQQLGLIVLLGIVVALVFL